MAHLAAERLPAGRHERAWTPGSLARGTYFYRLMFEETVQCRRMVLR